MITDSQTNKVFLATGLAHYAEACKNLLQALSEERIPTAFLPLTESEKHIWARDYMPIQLAKDQFLFYYYNPDYLKGYEDYIPDYCQIVRQLYLPCETASIVLDGGNVVKCGDKVIMTDKIFKENPDYSRQALVGQLEQLLEAEIVLIPRDGYEMCGHADGMVRSISGNRVLVNNYADLDPYLRKRLLTALLPHFEVEELAYGIPGCSKLSWAYLNFLQTKSCIFVPGLNIPEDRLAVEQIRHFYPEYKVIQIQGCKPIVREGGALNCISWNILADAAPEER